MTFAAPPSSFFRSHLRSCLPPLPSSPSSPPSLLASPLTPISATVVTPCPLCHRCRPSTPPPPVPSLPLSQNPSCPLSLFIFFVFAKHHPSPLHPPPPSPTTPPQPSAPLPCLSLSFSFVRSIVRHPPLLFSPSISASISSAEHRWPPPSPSSLYPHLSHHDCHHPYFPSSFPWCRRHLSAPSTAGFSPSSPPSAAIAPAPSSPCRRRFPSPSPTSV